MAYSRGQSSGRNGGQSYGRGRGSSRSGGRSGGRNQRGRAEYDNTNRGALWVNDDARGDRDPGWKGTINVDGAEFFLSMWEADGGGGNSPEFRVAVTPKDGKRSRGGQRDDDDRSRSDSREDSRRSDRGRSREDDREDRGGRAGRDRDDRGGSRGRNDGDDGDYPADRDEDYPYDDDMPM